MAKPELKAECRRLRTENRLSLREIHIKTGVSKGTLSNWLRDIPLTETEKKKRLSENGKVAGRSKVPRGEKAKFFDWAKWDEMTTHEKAKIAEAAVLFRLCVLNISTFGSPFDGDKADWVIEVPERKFYKIQVKLASSPSTGSPGVSLRRTPVSGTRYSRYEKGEFDFIIGYDFYTDTCYVWSWEEVERHKNTITVNPEAAEAWHKLRK